MGRRIARLERKLGIQLVSTVAHGIELTPEAQRIFGHAAAADSQLQRAWEVAHDVAEVTEGECKITLGDGLATYWLPRFLSAFATRYPKIALLTYATNERTVSKSPNCDIQIQYAEKADESLVAREAGALHLMLFASAEYLAQHGTPLVMDDLAKHRLVDLTLVGSEKGTFAAWSGRANRTAFIANANGTHCEAIRWGAGIGLLPTYATLLYPNLVPVLPVLRYRAPVFLCFERGVTKRPAVKATLSFLRETVFDRTRMPWFADTFTPPDPAWHDILALCMGNVFDSSMGDLAAE